MIGTGSVGGKASGLLFIDRFLRSDLPENKAAEFDVHVPVFTVIGTDVFDAFLDRNKLLDFVLSDSADDVLALEFQKAHLPAEILGDLRGLIEKVHTPLAVRSSSLLEDALYQPFAGVYNTKMIPNNQPSPDIRFQKLMEAIKLVYASTFTRSAKDYMRAIGRTSREEKMAVIIQEVVGKRYENRFYPNVSGVARSFNFYSMGRAKPEDGVVDLALGLGKTIVDGGRCWTYSPAYPKLSAPFASAKAMLSQTQTEFWAVNMGKPAAYDPILETEFMVQLGLQDAESDGTLRFLAGTYDAGSDRITTSLDIPGARVLNFGGLLIYEEMRLNDAIKILLETSERALKAPVEIEFAVTFNPNRIGFLQVRPMVVSEENVEIADNELSGKNILLASDKVLGNGVSDEIRDIVYVKPDCFEARHTPQIAQEVELVNRRLIDLDRPYLLIGFGRWGSSDPWLGIPVTWGQVCGARVIVEATKPGMDVELSQGSHFFHNLTSFKVSYFSVAHSGDYKIDWEWLRKQPCTEELSFIRHVHVENPIRTKVDGRSSKGAIWHSSN